MESSACRMVQSRVNYHWPMLHPLCFCVMFQHWFQNTSQILKGVSNAEYYFETERVAILSLILWSNELSNVKFLGKFIKLLMAYHKFWLPSFYLRIGYQFWSHLAENADGAAPFESGWRQHYEWDRPGRTCGVLPCLWSHAATGKTKEGF